jgi:hypothetical protein
VTPWRAVQVPSRTAEEMTVAVQRWVRPLPGYARRAGYPRPGQVAGMSFGGSIGSPGGVMARTPGGNAPWRAS